MENIITQLQKGGSSPFFFTSALQSAVFGELGRKNQKELVESNLDFRKRLQKVKDEFSEERLEEQIRYKRETYELGRQYLIQQTILQNDLRTKEIEFQDFINHGYWPLNCSAYSLLELHNDLLKRSIVPLRVLIAKTEVTAFDRAKRDSSYDIFVNKVKDSLSELPNISILDRPWKNASQSTICDSMNLHFIMQGVPTLLVFPYQIGDQFGIEISMWSFVRGAHSMQSRKILKINSFDATKNIDHVVLALKAAIGMTRDTYMIAEYHSPARFISMIDETILEIGEIRHMIIGHYSELINAVMKNQEYRSICAHHELEEIVDSLSYIKQITV